jgi:DNA-binding NarL/FixJ family response regulator
LSKKSGVETTLQPVRVLIADDHPRSRDGLRALLATSAAVKVVGEAANGEEAVRLVETCGPDVVLLDLEMPVMSGLDAADYIKQHWPEVKVCILTMSKAIVSGGGCPGVDEILVKGCPVEKLWAAILRSGSSPDG